MLDGRPWLSGIPGYTIPADIIAIYRLGSRKKKPTAVLFLRVDRKRYSSLIKWLKAVVTPMPPSISYRDFQYSSTNPSFTRPKQLPAQAFCPWLDVGFSWRKYGTHNKLIAVVVYDQIIERLPTKEWQPTSYSVPDSRKNNWITRKIRQEYWERIKDKKTMEFITKRNSRKSRCACRKLLYRSTIPAVFPQAVQFRYY